MHAPSIPPDIGDAQAGAFALLYLAENRLITEARLGHRFALFFSTRKRAERYLRLETLPEACEWIGVIPVSREFVNVTQRLELINFILGRMSGSLGKGASFG